MKDPLAESDALPLLPAGVRQFRGQPFGCGRRVGLVAARFNLRLSGALVTAAVDTLLFSETAPEDVEVDWVPGSFEIPLGLRRLARRGRFDALIACGVVLQGETLHAQLIMRSLTAAFVQLSLELDCPVIDAVVSSPSVDLAEARCLPGPSNRGVYAARAALEMADRQLPHSS